MNIVDPILFQCRHSPPSPAICAPGRAVELISYARLELAMNNVMRNALASGLSSGQTVAIFAEDFIVHGILILGLARLGIVTLTSRGLALPSGLKIDAAITFGGQQVTGAARVIAADSSWLSGDGSPPSDPRVFAGSDDDVCRIILTSGTTGEPKGVAITHRMLTERIGRHHTVYGSRLPQCSRTFCDFGFSTSLGFQFFIYMLSRGGMICSIGDTPVSTLQSLELYKIQNLVGSPAGLNQYASFYEAYPPFQSRLEMILSGGSLLSKALSERVRTRLCSNLVSSYGSTEASIVATAPAHMVADIPGAVGFLTPGVTVESVDAEGRPVSFGKEGLLRIRSPLNAKAYLGAADESAAAFRDGWFYPGDIGYVTPERMLVILGREKSVINVGGDKINPETLEEVLSRAPMLEEGAVLTLTNAAGTDQLVALIVPRPDFDARQLKKFCQENLPRHFLPEFFVSVERLPRNEMGKVERRWLEEMARARLAQASG